MQPYAAQHLRPSSCARAPSPRPPSTACAAAKPKSFSPLQAFGLFKNKPKAEKDPVTQALEEMEFRHPANAKATRAAAAAAEKAKLEAERREVRSCATHAHRSPNRPVCPAAADAGCVRRA